MAGPAAGVAPAPSQPAWRPAPPTTSRLPSQPTPPQPALPASQPPSLPRPDPGPARPAPARHHADLEVEMGSEAVLRAVAGALAVEAGDGPDGTRLVLRAEGTRLRATVEADSASSLRAALNSLVRLLDAARRVVQLR